MPNKRIYSDKDYLEEKFQDISAQILDLKTHVNDEILILRKNLQSLKKWVIVIGIITIALLLIHVDQFGPMFLGGLRKFIGL